jgi:quinol monooxygenase YgiN
MTSTVQMLIAAAAIGALGLTSAHAQTPPPPEGPIYTVTYVDVIASAKDEGAALLRAYRDATRKEDGNLRSGAARRIGQPNQFVFMTAWRDFKAFEAHGKAAQTVQFQDKFKAIQGAPLDERVHVPLSVGPVSEGQSRGGAAILAVTHVDVIPPRKDDGTALVKQLGDDARKQDGNLRFDVVVQTNRPNHFSVIETWRDRKSADAHSSSSIKRTFRDRLAPMSGALYDERFYKALN